MRRPSNVVPTYAKGLSISLIGAAALAGACTTDGFSPPPGEDGDPSNDPRRIANVDDPAADERLNQLNIACETEYVLSGSFVEGQLRPEDHEGACWPVGNWTFSATVERLGCDPQPNFPGTMAYEFTVNEEDSTTRVNYLDDPESERVNLKVSTAGDSLCHGEMSHFGTNISPEGELAAYPTWLLRPNLHPDGTITGVATYSLYLVDDPF